MVANQYPLNLPPTQAGREKTLDRPIAPSFASPTRHPPHRHAAAHREHRLAHPGELANRGAIQTLAYTSKKDHNIRHGRLLLVQRWVGESLFYTGRSRPASLLYAGQLPCVIPFFGEGIVKWD